MTQVPTPRFDLLKMRDYMFGSVQFSRGCPYQCEFCDIIVTFGRRPRLKTSAQVIAELEALRAQKIFIAFVVDDNLIGNKKAIKALLRDLIAWQQAQGYPMSFFTEASLDLAEDAGAAGADGRGEFRRRVRRHRKSRTRRRCARRRSCRTCARGRRCSTAFTRSRRRDWRSGAG